VEKSHNVFAFCFDLPVDSIRLL